MALRPTRPIEGRRSFDRQRDRTDEGGRVVRAAHRDGNRRFLRTLNRSRPVPNGRIRSQFAQRAVQRAEYEVAYASRVAKANFVFCRMHVHVDLPSVELEIQHEYRVATVEQDVAI